MEKPTLGPHPVLGIEEFRTDEELEELLFDMNIGCRILKFTVYTRYYSIYQIISTL